MAKLATHSALLLLAMVGLALATTYTTITTTTIDEEVTNPTGRGSREKCTEEIREQEVSHCEMFLQCESGPPRHHESLRMVVIPASTTSECEEQHLRKCCIQLGDVKEECRCKALEEMIKQQSIQQRRVMTPLAQYLPNRCEMEPRGCDLQGWF